MTAEYTNDACKRRIFNRLIQNFPHSVQSTDCLDDNYQRMDYPQFRHNYKRLLKCIEGMSNDGYITFNKTPIQGGIDIVDTPRVAIDIYNNICITEKGKAYWRELQNN